MQQLRFLGFTTKLQRIDKAGDPLRKQNESVDWEQFRPILEKARAKEIKSPAGAKGYDVVLLFKVLILQSLYNLADSAVEFQILDRCSFSRFLGLRAASKVPNATTIWLFQEDLIRVQVVEELFNRFDQFLGEADFRAQKGQKDADALWTKKNGKSFFGYKNHISVDVKHKLIRKFHVTSAEVLTVGFQLAAVSR